MGRALRESLKTRREALRGLGERLSRQRPQARLTRDRAELNRLAERMKASLRDLLKAQRARAAHGRLGFERAAPIKFIHAQRQHLRVLGGELTTLERHALTSAQGGFHSLAARLEAMSPLAVLARGYSVTFRRADGAVVRRASQVKVGDDLAIRLAAPGSRTLAECEEVDATVTRVKDR